MSSGGRKGDLSKKREGFSATAGLGESKSDNEMRGKRSWKGTLKDEGKGQFDYTESITKVGEDAFSPFTLETRTRKIKGGKRTPKNSQRLYEKIAGKLGKRVHE